MAVGATTGGAVGGLGRGDRGGEVGKVGNWVEVVIGSTSQNMLHT